MMVNDKPTCRMTIYRFEHGETGIGPYNSFTDDYRVADMVNEHMCDIHGHPNPENDGGHCMSYDERCAFPTLEALYSWFTESEIELLESLGFEIKVFEADVTFISEKQVVFLREE